MDRILLHQKCTYSPVPAVIGRLAMGIITAPEEERGSRYLSVRKSVEEAIKRFGIEGHDADDCLLRNMSAIRAILRDAQKKRV
jgi:hypothetical protein